MLIGNSLDRSNTFSEEIELMFNNIKVRVRAPEA